MENLRIKMENKKLELQKKELIPHLGPSSICLLRQARLVGLFLGYSVAAFFLNMYETWPSHLRPVFFGDKDERPARKKKHVFEKLHEKQDLNADFVRVQ